MCTHLHKCGSTYYFRRAIPHDLMAVYGRAEIHHILGTRDRTEAVLRCRQMSVQYDLEFQAKRAGVDARKFSCFLNR